MSQLSRVVYRSTLQMVSLQVSSISTQTVLTLSIICMLCTISYCFSVGGFFHDALRLLEFTLSGGRYTVP